MKRVVVAIILGVLMGSSTTVLGASMSMSTSPAEPVLGEVVQFQCAGGAEWRGTLTSAKINITNAREVNVVRREDMRISGTAATYDYFIPADERSGTWRFECVIRERGNRADETNTFTVVDGGSEPPANNPPRATNDSATTPFESAVTIDVAANDSDVDGNLAPDTVEIVNGPSNGTTSLAGGGSVAYTPGTGFSGTDSFEYKICDSLGLCGNAIVSVTVEASQPPTEPPVNEPPIAYLPGTNNQHDGITEYNGPSTCLQCHKSEASEMLNTLHMNWAGPTPHLTNDTGEDLGKGYKGINTFCTYAPSSKGACYSCHVRADGNAPDAPTAEDVDCLMCHSDAYQRKFVADPNNTVTVFEGTDKEKTYVFGKVDESGNYTTVPDYSQMTINVVDAARTVHLPTNTSCLRCHAKAGGGDWTKRGDMGLNSANATVDQDVHLAKAGAGLSCIDCHSASNHQISGRGIDLRQTEAAAPTCAACHSESPHSNSTLNRHAGGQVSCQVCHIRTFGKGGATEMSRDWLVPTWNPAFCSGQGGYVGHEVKESNVKPEYVWFDGTSYVYNVGETIQPEPAPNGDILHMAKANGALFKGNSKIVPIKRHLTNMPLDDNGKIIPPAIMWMFMTGDFDVAVQKGIEEQAAKGESYSGNYRIVEADAEMLITHGVDPKSKAPSCIECHDGSGSTPDTYGMVPFDKLGYHTFDANVLSCNKCHGREDNLSFENLHQRHRGEGVSCQQCHVPNSNG